MVVSVRRCSTVKYFKPLDERSVLMNHSNRIETSWSFVPFLVAVLSKDIFPVNANAIEDLFYLY